ncbi:hypothetical protein GCM10010909_10780 [Acidocella aquatica]|uniref:Transposase n=2 Tax=Acidocella aquatica TaxID=1922313 RepID=A0ABQ6A433_9PROT|nr:hypothetical protein GCM10010909_10780 [Acidocella aquatica]
MMPDSGASDMPTGIRSRRLKADEAALVEQAEPQMALRPTVGGREVMEDYVHKGKAHEPTPTGQQNLPRSQAARLL